MLLNRRGEPQQGEDLRDAGAGDALTAGDRSLVGNVASVELTSPLDGVAEEDDGARRLGLAQRPDLDRERVAAGVSFGEVNDR